MKLFWKTLVMVVAVVTSTMVAPLMARQAPDAQAEPAAVSIDGVDLKDVSSDRIRFDVRSHVAASRKLRIKRVRFEQMRLGNLPIYLSPIEERLELEKGAAVTLPRIPLTIYFRDLDSLDPLERAVRDGQATFEGKAHVDLDLNLLEQVVSRQWSARADMPIAMKIPVEVPGGMAGRTAALATLRAAQFAMNLGGSALHALRQSQKGWEEELRTRYASLLVVAESRYSLQLRNNQRADFTVRGLGFRISEDKFVLTGEIIEPWKYDTEQAAALQTGAASLIEEGRDLLVWPSGEALNTSSARSLSGGMIHVEHTSGKTEVAHVSSDEKSVKVRLLRRDSDANYAVLRFTRPEDARKDDKGSAIPLAPEQVRHSQNWDRLTLFRVDDNGKLELISTPAHREDGRILLEDPVDESTFGSLLIAPEGAVGMVQEERTGMVLRSEW